MGTLDYFRVWKFLRGVGDEERPQIKPRKQNSEVGYMKADQPGNIEVKSKKGSLKVCLSRIHRGVSRKMNTKNGVFLSPILI